MRTLASAFRTEDLVGLGRFELPTSPLSGVRSNQLSYRPARKGGRRSIQEKPDLTITGTAPSLVANTRGARSRTGGAGRDRTGDLLNANQALSQLSYSPVEK